MHSVAVQRGEGLLPQLADLLQRAMPASQAHRAEPRSSLAPPEPDPDRTRT
jgi:hypothetical protein